MNSRLALVIDLAAGDTSVGSTPSSRFASNQIFMDVDNLDAGIDFVEALGESVGSCDVLIAVIGGRWLIAQSG
jgi:hypothetical protein